ncbi:MAG TPA: MFS transporter [Gaiellaceae bacterium]|nr:MFS transporter [Gaiellaceae bacterium]
MRLDRAALGGLALAFTPGFNVANVGAVADHVSRAYGVSLGVVGLFTTALFVSHAAMQVPMGRLCDRLGARAVGGAGLLVVAVASAAALGWREAGFAIAMRFVAGFGTAAAFVGGSDYVRATIGSPVAIGMFGASSMAGGGLAVALLPLWGSWRAPFVSAAAVAAAGALVVALAPHDGARGPVVRGYPLDRRLAPLAAIHAASFGLSVVLGNWVVTLLHRAGGTSDRAAGIAGGLILFLGLISRPLGGRLLNRPGLIRASFVAAAAGTVLLLLATPYAVAVLGAAIVGLAAGVPFAPAFANAVRIRPDAPGAAVGLVNMAAAVTIVVGTPLLGLSFSLPGDGRIGFAVVAALCLAAAGVRVRAAA